MKIPALLGIAVILIAIGLGIFGAGLWIARMRAKGQPMSRQKSGMNPLTRKARTEDRLKREKIPFNEFLPCIEAEEDTRLRQPKEVGIRICCLFCTVGSAFEREDDTFKYYLREHGLWEHLTPAEVAFLSAENPPQQSIVNFSWRSEALFVLLWSVGKFDQLGLPTSQIDSSEIISRVPGVREAPWHFIESLQLRAKCELMDASDLVYRLHWAARQSQMDGRPMPAGLIQGVVQEWHHAINWITCYEDQDWDDVSTDT